MKANSLATCFVGFFSFLRQQQSGLVHTYIFLADPNEILM